jgi:hypothetical protein
MTSYLKREQARQFFRKSFPRLPLFRMAEYSVVRAVLIGHLHRMLDGSAVPILCLFCSSQNDRHQVLRSLIGVLLRQLVEHSGLVSRRLLQIFHDHRERHAEPSDTDLISALIQALGDNLMAYIVVDAVDECQHSAGELLDALSSLPKSIAVMITSQRPPTGPFAAAEHLVIRAAEADLRAYAQQRLNRSKFRGLDAVDFSLYEQILSVVVGQSNGQ